MSLLEDCKAKGEKSLELINRIEKQNTIGNVNIFDVSMMIDCAEKFANEVRKFGINQYRGNDFLRDNIDMLNNIILENSGITYEYFSNDKIILHLGKLSIKRKDIAGGKAFLRDSMMLVIKEINEKYKIEKKRDRWVVFSFNISNDKRTARKIIDYDNADTNTIINCLTSLTLYNDSPFYYNLSFYRNEIPSGQEPSTDIYILSTTEYFNLLGEQFQNEEIRKFKSTAEKSS